jgi:endonuclease/exonuclease/phosphatase family metal-dependent hydrolase
MKRFVVVMFVLFVFVQFVQFVQGKEQDAIELKVMSFNIWVGGGKSIDETANVIKTTSADIVGIQESSKGKDNNAVKIAKGLGWHSCVYAGCTIISRYPIVKTSPNQQGCKIQIGKNQFVWMFNIHLKYCPYGPYQLNGIPYCGAPLLDNEKDAIDTALKTHQNAVEAIISEIKEAQKDNCPIFLTGDFNEPSHLDWTGNAAKSGICKMPVAWPSTKALMEKANLKDSYRTKYPNEVTHKGHTWTTFPAKREVLDRIDFVFFYGTNVEVTDVKVVGEKSDLSDIKFEKYPSDHRAVLGIFKLLIL